jgi:hypothetical protein
MFDTLGRRTHAVANQDARTVAEMAFEPHQRGERAISNALKLEQQRHEAAIKNVQRLRQLRLSKQKAAAR